MITLDEKTVAIWQMSLPPNINWIAALRREPDHWLLQYCFRYEEDDLVFHSKDRKSWYTCHISSTLTQSEALDKARVAFNQMAFLGQATLHEYTGTPEEIMAGLKSNPTFHMQEAPHHEA